MVWRLLTPLMFAFIKRFGLPHLETERFARGRRRLGTAILLAIASLALSIAGLLLTMVDVAVQFEQHGFFAWNGMMWTGVALLALGIGTGIGARLALPGVSDFVPFAPRAGGRGLSRSSLKEPARRPPRRPEYAH